jgi:hypothetical protein
MSKKPKTHDALVFDASGWRLVSVEMREDGGLAALQALVGGYIEPWPVRVPGLTIYVNEDGIALGLPVFALVDGCTARGPVVVVPRRGSVLPAALAERAAWFVRAVGA